MQELLCPPAFLRRRYNRPLSHVARPAAGQRTDIKTPVIGRKSTETNHVGLYSENTAAVTFNFLFIALRYQKQIKRQKNMMCEQIFLLPSIL